MRESEASPVEGQLVWCPVDPSLGVGVITEVEGTRIHVRFLRLQEQRAYTTRGDQVILRYEIQPGERVQHQGRELRVTSRVDAGEALALYELEDGTEVAEKELVPNIRDIGAKERLATLNLVHPEVVRARMQGIAVSSIGSRPGVAAVLGSRVLWLPHQIDVAVRAIEHDPVRMLLADEVGLGKTVEAALIYAGLRHEGRANRILILTPDSLAIQWLGEIYRKTHELLVLLDDERLDDAAQDFPDLTPFDAYQRIVASIDRVSADPVLSEECAQAQWDLVVVDEAHHLRWRPDGGGNAGYRLVEALAQNSHHLLLLTATPMALDPAEYHALLRLLDPGRFDNPSAFSSITERVGKIRDVARHIARAVDLKEPVPKPAQKMAKEVLADDPEDQTRFRDLLKLPVASAMRRQVADEILDALRARHGLADYVVRNRRGPVGGLPVRCPQVFPLEPTELQDHLIEVGETVMLELARTIDEPSERARTLGSLLRALWAAPRALADILQPVSPQLVSELAPYVGRVIGAPLDGEGLPTGDARLRWLGRLIRRLGEGEKVLVFVESAVAVQALKDSLEPLLGSDIAVFHRGLAPRDQDRQVAWFRDSRGPQVMLSTEAGGEGRNFQFCHRVVLYDLPWRPATIEQRIGRVDRVGQQNDVHVLVPYFKGGYEAAILKVMQEAIGVLDRTVGGIDHALEYVSNQLGELVLSGAGSDEWKALYLETATLIKDTRERIEAAVDPIIDHASFSPQRASRILQAVPEDIEAKTEAFVRGYASHSKLDLHTKSAHLVAAEDAPSAAGGLEGAYVATFQRTHALDHEDVEFLSYGHPLVDQACTWAHEADDAAAALAICRGFEADGAVFLWSYELDVPEDVPEAAAYFENPLYTFAVDEGGKRHPELEGLLTSERALDRMDPAPLRASGNRWRRVVEENHEATEKLAEASVREAVVLAKERFAARMALRERDLCRQEQRELTRMNAEGNEGFFSQLAVRVSGRKSVEEAYQVALDDLEREKARVIAAIENARPRLLTAVAVRLMKAKQVSG